MLERWMLGLIRLLPKALSSPGSHVPTPGSIGPGFPEWRAASLGELSSPGVGLLKAPETLSITSPSVSDFYRSSADYRLIVQTRFPWYSRWSLPWYRRLFADPWGQLQFPLNTDAPLTDRFVAVGEETWWVRGGNEGTMYCARFDTLEVDGQHRLRVTIPTPILTLIALFTPYSGTTSHLFHQAKAPAGLYLAPAEGPIRRLPFFREEIYLVEARTGLVVRHRFRFAGIDLATLLYLVERR